MPSGTSSASGTGGAGGKRGRRTLVLAAAWAGVTAVACAVVWLGVDSVLIPAAETPPAVLAAGAGAAGANSGSAITTSKPPTVPVSPSPSPDTSAPALLPSPSVPAPRSGPPSSSPTPSPTSSTRRYATGGGVVVLAISAHFVSLVSATPAAGYSVQNWSADGWLRVDFDQGSTTYSVFATWNGYSPQVQVVSPSPGN